MAKEDVVLKVEDLFKSYGDEKVLRGISFEVRKGETLILCGPSGSGKSTLLRCINQLTVPDEGRVFFEGEEITNPDTDMNKVRKKIGFVFQHFNLFNHLTALRNASIGPEKVEKIEGEKAEKIAMEQLKRVGLEEHVDKYPGQLSGGQKQRVGIARALTMDPVIMFYDEPTSALDPELIGEVLAVMKMLSEEKMTSIVVTHELGFAMSAGDRMIFLKDGKIREKGTPEKLINNPETEEAKSFFERTAEFYGRE